MPSINSVELDEVVVELILVEVIVDNIDEVVVLVGEEVSFIIMIFFYVLSKFI
jgi:hypothetical protein